MKVVLFATLAGTAAAFAPESSSRPCTAVKGAMEDLKGIAEKSNPVLKVRKNILSMVSSSWFPCCDVFCVRIVPLDIFLRMRTPVPDVSRAEDSSARCFTCSSQFISEPKFYHYSTMILWNWSIRLSGEATKLELLDSCAILKSNMDVLPWLPLWDTLFNLTESTSPGP